MGKSPFLWGDNGAALTPAQVADRRRIAEALAGQASDTSPVGHWTAALNRGLQGYFAGKDNKSAQAAEAAGMAEANALASGIGMGGASPVAAALAGGGQMQPGAGYTAPAEAAEIRAGLLARGLPEHIADGFIMNMQDESGLNPGINEANPIVPGSRGGFGLYQLTGPRRVAYEGFAADRGVDPSDTNAQLDFLMSELQGPESRAAKAIFSTKDAGSAGAAIVNHFLRPAEEHRTARANRYMGAGSGVSQAPSAPNVSGLASAMGNPWFKERYGDVASALMDQQMQQQNAAYRQQLDQQDPRNQVALEMAQLELDRARNPAPKMNYVQMPNGEFMQVNETAGTMSSLGNFAAPESPPPSVQEFQYGSQNPEFNQWDMARRAASRAQTNVNVGAGETEFDKSMGKADADLLSTASTTGIAAQRNLARIDELGSLLEAAPTGAAGLFAQAAGGWGIGVPGASEVQAAEALINSLVPEQRQPGSGPMSDADLALFKKSLPRIINQPDGNRRILSTMRAITSYDAQGADIAARVRLPEGDPNRLTRSQAIQALQSRPDPLASIKAERPNTGAEQPQSGYAASWTDMGNGVKIRRRE